MGANIKAAKPKLANFIWLILFIASLFPPMICYGHFLLRYSP